MRIWWPGRAQQARDAALSAAQQDAAHALALVCELSKRAAYAPPDGGQGRDPAAVPGNTTPSNPRRKLYAWDNPITYSTPQSPKRRPDTYVSLDDLRRMADSYDVLRSCIQHLKREVSAVPIKIVSREAGDDTPAMKAVIKEAEAWFGQSGGLGGVGSRRSHFEGMVIEDLSVIGAAAVYYSPARDGRPYEAVAVDAATIRPRVDGYGWDDAKPYEQWVQGLKVAEFTRDELWYDGLYPVSYTPYFKSPVEWLILCITSAIKADEWNRTWLTDGSTPSDMLAVPEDWKPGDIKEYSDFWDALHSGNIKNRQKTRFVPSGFSKLLNPSRKDQDFQEFELWLLRRTCAIMGVQPAAIGFAGEQYKVSQDGSMDATTQFGAGAILEYRKAHYDDMLVRLGYPDLECQNVTNAEEDAASRTERLIKACGVPYLKLNEARALDGKEAVEGGDVVLVPSTVIPLLDLITQSDLTTAQSEQQLEQGEMGLTPGASTLPPGQEGGAPGGGGNKPGGGTFGQRVEEIALELAAQVAEDTMLHRAVGEAAGGTWVTVDDKPVFIKAGQTNTTGAGTVHGARKAAQAQIHAKHAALSAALKDAGGPESSFAKAQAAFAQKPEKLQKLADKAKQDLASGNGGSPERAQDQATSLKAAIDALHAQAQQLHAVGNTAGAEALLKGAQSLQNSHHYWSSLAGEHEKNGAKVAAEAEKKTAAAKEALTANMQPTPGKKDEAKSGGTEAGSAGDVTEHDLKYYEKAVEGAKTHAVMFAEKAHAALEQGNEMEAQQYAEAAKAHATDVHYYEAAHAAAKAKLDGDKKAAALFEKVRAKATPSAATLATTAKQAALDATKYPNMTPQGVQQSLQANKQGQIDALDAMQAAAAAGNSKKAMEHASAAAFAAEGVHYWTAFAKAKEAQEKQAAQPDHFGEPGTEAGAKQGTSAPEAHEAHLQHLQDAPDALKQAATVTPEKLAQVQKNAEKDFQNHLEVAGPQNPKDVAANLEEAKAKAASNAGQAANASDPEDKEHHAKAATTYAWHAAYWAHYQKLAQEHAGGGTPEPEAAPTKAAPTKAAPPLDVEDLTKVGPKPGGSVPGAMYQDKDGQKWLVKEVATQEHAQNEVMAGALYKALGINVPELRVVHGPEGQKWVGSKWLEGAKSVAGELSKGEYDKALPQFVAHAWLANWDAAGLEHDNIVEHNGKATPIDLGGALEFRAQGGKKGAAFGNQVTELSTLKDPSKNPAAAKAFKNVSPEDLKHGANALKKISSDQIHQIVTAHGGSNALAAKLIARKQDLLQQLGEADAAPAAPGTPSAGAKAAAPSLDYNTHVAALHPDLKAKGTLSDQEIADHIALGKKAAGKSPLSAETAHAQAQKHLASAAKDAKSATNAHKKGDTEKAAYYMHYVGYHGQKAAYHAGISQAKGGVAGAASPKASLGGSPTPQSAVLSANGPKGVPHIDHTQLYSVQQPGITNLGVGAASTHTAYVNAKYQDVLNSYTPEEKARISGYTGSSFGLNTALRQAKGEVPDHYQGMVKHLDSAMNKSKIKEPLVLWRGENLSSKQDPTTWVDSEFTNHEFGSWSTGTQKPQDSFASGGPVHLLRRITLQPGHKAIPTTPEKMGYDTEREFILHRGTKMRTTHVETATIHGKLYHIVHQEILAQL